MALVGVLLLVIAMPSGSPAKIGAVPEKNKEMREPKEEDAPMEQEDYTAYLERRLKEVLEQMEGVGEVSVMITVADHGERVVEKDRTKTSRMTEEKDSGGGVRTITENENQENSVSLENGSDTAPYISKEKMPSIEGVVIVAQGGGNPRTAADISEMVKALFAVEAHRIKIVKMGVREEKT